MSYYGDCYGCGKLIESGSGFCSPECRERYDDELEALEAEAPPACELCHGELEQIGQLGDATHYRCRQCGSFEHYQEAKT